MAFLQCRVGHAAACWVTMRVHRFKSRRPTMTPRSLLILAMAFGHGAAFGADTIEERTWNTSAELGAITTSGNTTGTSVTGKIDARHETTRWSHVFIASGYFKEDEYEDDLGERQKSRSAQRWATSAKA